MRHIFFSVGEPSGDLHGANLIRQLQLQDPQLQAVGFGGPEMASAGCDLHEDLTAWAVMGILPVLAGLPHFLNLVGRADRYLRRTRPDAVVLIDYPGFNWWIARRAKAYGIPVFYFTPPQLWAWATWRVRKMRRLVDHVLCALPFETEWFAARGCRATFVGHPFFDEVRRQTLDEPFLAEQRRDPRRLIALLPGSRTQEVHANLAHLVRTAELIHAQVPETRFAVAAFKPHHAEFARQLVAGSKLPIDVHLRRTPELIRAAHSCVAVSGSVSLELLAQTLPTVIHYWISPRVDRLQRRFRKVKYITLVNLLAAKEIFPQQIGAIDPDSPEGAEMLFPEYLTSVDASAAMARQVVRWLNDATAYEALRARLAALRDQVGHGGAAQAAAQVILSALDARQLPIPRPHWTPKPRAEAQNSVSTISSP